MDVKVRKAHILLWACGETLGLKLKVVHSLCIYHLAVHHFCILSMVAWVSDGRCQENTKQSTKTCVLGQNGSYTHYSYWCKAALTGLPPLDLVTQGGARSAAHCLWSLGCWSCLHTSRGHSSIMMWLQR